MVLSQHPEVQMGFKSGVKSVTRNTGNIGKVLKLASTILSHIVLNNVTFMYLHGMCFVEWEHKGRIKRHLTLWELQAMLYADGSVPS